MRDEGRIEKPSRWSPFGITRLAECWQTMIPNDGFSFYPHTTSGLFLLLTIKLIIFMLKKDSQKFLNTFICDIIYNDVNLT